MQDIPPTAGSPWLYIVGAILAAVSGAGGIVAIYTAIINRRKPRAEIQNANADTGLKNAQTGKTMAEMLGMVIGELNESLCNQRDTTEQMRKMQVQFDEMAKRCERLEATEASLRLANMQVERARRAGFLSREERLEIGPNPAADVTDK